MRGWEGNGDRPTADRFIEVTGLRMNVTDQHFPPSQQTNKNIIDPRPPRKTSGIDFSNFDDAAVRKVEKALQGLEVGVLINNVGVSYEFPMYFEELSDEQVGARGCACGRPCGATPCQERWMWDGGWGMGIGMGDGDVPA